MKFFLGGIFVKKLVMLLSAIIIAVASSVNCFAFMRVEFLCRLDSYTESDGRVFTGLERKNKETLRKEFSKNFSSGMHNILVEEDNLRYFANCLVSDEIKYINGKPMIKVRDVAEALGGKVEYNSTNKLTKVYLWEATQPKVYVHKKSDPEIHTTCSFSLTSGKPKINLSVGTSYQDLEYSSFVASVIPIISGGSLYVSTADLGKILGKAEIVNGIFYCWLAYERKTV